MPLPFPAEFYLRAVALMRAGKTITATAAELGISTGALHNWVRQGQIDRCERPGLTTYVSAEPEKAKKQIRQRGRVRDCQACREAARGGPPGPAWIVP